MAGHGPLRLQPEPDEGPEPVPADPAAPHSPGLHAEAAEDHQARTEEVSSTPGRGRGHPTQDHTNIPQSLLP